MADPTSINAEKNFKSGHQNANHSRRTDLKKTVVLRRNEGHQNVRPDSSKSAAVQPISGVPVKHGGRFSPVKSSNLNNNASLVARRPPSPSTSATSGANQSLRSTSHDRGMWPKLNGLSNKSAKNEQFTTVNLGPREKRVVDPPPSRIPQRTNSPSIKPVIYRTLSTESRFSHTLKSNNRINMSFDNSKYWEIEKTNRFLAERIQNTKPTYSRMPAESRPLRSRFELKQSKDFFSLQRDNMRIATRIVQAKPTVPAARPKSSLAGSRPSSSASTFNYSSVSRSESYSNLRRPEWNSRW
ncbi:uncharacterized protein LOC129589380 [Paramacrobiotus metropolitanus]|uniref:uncharacterized protein LOC129589380 n=1 Tax=Paramacrobiotus metropolitanus TaxID=2943436 RepID=UPI002445D396|nr:uncharacterized protein LOC129589380 [Paramacrobiotus metropolitanus]